MQCAIYIYYHRMGTYIRDRRSEPLERTVRTNVRISPRRWRWMGVAASVRPAYACVIDVLQNRHEKSVID